MKMSNVDRAIVLLIKEFGSLSETIEVSLDEFLWGLEEYIKDNSVFFSGVLDDVI